MLLLERPLDEQVLGSDDYSCGTLNQTLAAGYYSLHLDSGIGIEKHLVDGHGQLLPAPPPAWDYDTPNQSQRDSETVPLALHDEHSLEEQGLERDDILDQNVLTTSAAAADDDASWHVLVAPHQVLSHYAV